MHHVKSPGVPPKRAFSIPVATKQYLRPDLWHEALGQLHEDDRESLGLDPKASRLDIRGLLSLVEDKRAECDKRRWTSYKKENGKEVSPRKSFERVAMWLQKFKEVGDQAVPFGGPHAALPWAAVRLVLQLTVNDIETFSAMAEGLELVARIVVTFNEIESDFICGQSVLEAQLNKHLIGLYASVLVYLGKARHYYNRSKIEKVMKGAFQTAEQTVKKYIDTMVAKEMEVMKLIELLGWTGVKRDMAALLDRQNNVDSVMKEDRVKNMLLWLNPANFREEYEEALDSLQQGTGTWIFDRTEFKTWIDSKDIQDRRVLWLRGPPGFGKTVLCANIISYLITQRLAPVAYFFCTSKAEDKSKPKAILKAWIHQMVNNNDANVRLIEGIAEKNITVPPTSSDLWKMFEILVAANPNQFLVIDGYDECLKVSSDQGLIASDAADLVEEEVTNFLKQLLRVVSKVKARVLLVSRGNSAIHAAVNVIKKETRLNLCGEYQIEKTDTAEDVKLFSLKIVNDQLGDNNKPDSLIRQEIATDAATKADGMFLWLSLLRRKLVGNRTAALRKAVDKFPSSVGNIYKEDLNLLSATPDVWSWTKTILRWVIFAFRPLTVRELLEAVSTTLAAESEEFEQGMFQPDDFHGSGLDEDFVADNIQRACRSFITLRKPEKSNEHMGIDCFTVHLSHHSVKEFLVSLESSAVGEGCIFSVEIDENAILAKSCLKYLLASTFTYSLLDDKNWKDNLDKYPFYWYAAQRWKDHILANNASLDLVELAADLLDPKRENCSEWLTVFSTGTDNVDTGKYDIKLTMPSDGLLETAVKMEIDGLLVELLSRNHEWERDDVHAALLAATVAATPDNEFNKLEIRTLLGIGSNPLRLGLAYEEDIWDAIKGHEDSMALEIFSIFVEFDEEYQLRDEQTQTHVKIMRKALLKGLIPFSMVRYQMAYASGLFFCAAEEAPNPIRFAIDLGSKALLSFLLDHGFNPNHFDDVSGLHSDADHHRDDKNITNSDHEDQQSVSNLSTVPLVYAVECALLEGDWSICNLLIWRGANVHTQSGTNTWTVLDMLFPLRPDYQVLSTYEQVPGTFEHFLATVINFEFVSTITDSQSESLRTFMGDESQVPIFTGFQNLAYMAFLNQWKQLETLFQMKRNERDMEDNENENELNTALIAAAFSGSLETVQLLVDFGANAQTRLWNGRTALHYAARYRHCAVARLLLDRGASFMVADSEEQTPLDYFLLQFQVCSANHSLLPRDITDVLHFCDVVFNSGPCSRVLETLHPEESLQVTANEVSSPNDSANEWKVWLLIPSAALDGIETATVTEEFSELQVELKMVIVVDVNKPLGIKLKSIDHSWGYFISSTANRFRALLALDDSVCMVEGDVNDRNAAMKGRLFDMYQLKNLLNGQSSSGLTEGDINIGEVFFTFGNINEVQLFNRSIRGLAIGTELIMMAKTTSETSVHPVTLASCESRSKTPSPSPGVTFQRTFSGDERIPSETNSSENDCNVSVPQSSLIMTQGGISLHSMTDMEGESRTNSRSSTNTETLRKSSANEDERVPSYLDVSSDAYGLDRYNWETNLPPGFERKYTIDGRPYYTDHNTKTTSWTLPEDKDYVLPLGYEKARTRGGKVFFVNHNTKTTSWHPPPRSSRDGLSHAKLPLAFEVRSTDKGRWYYVDHLTRSTGFGIPPHEMNRSEKDVIERLPAGFELRPLSDTKIKFTVYDFLKNELMPFIPPWVASYIAHHPPPQLPAGWERRHAGGKRYYVRSKDNKSATWDKPGDMTEWTEHVYDGVFYYVDHNTNTTSWTKPAC